MSEEITNQEPTTQEQVTGASISNADIRGSELFKSVTGKQQEKLDAVTAELESLKASIANEKEEARKAKLVEEGNFKQLMEEKDNEIANIRKSHESELRRMSLKDEFRKQGVNDEYFLSHHLGLFDGKPEEIEKYVSDLKEGELTAKYFGTPVVTPLGQPETKSATPGTRSNYNEWASIQADLKSGDPDKAKAASKAATQYYLDHGELPK